MAPPRFQPLGDSVLVTREGTYIDRDIWETLHNSHENPESRGHPLANIFGNPTPLTLVGMGVSSVPLACSLMGWRGAGGLGAAAIGPYYFMGGMMQVIGALLEFLLGNTFSATIYGTLGSFWLSYAATLQPYYNAEGAYNNGVAEITPEFAATYAYFIVAMGIVFFFFTICALRTNFVLVMLLLCLAMSFGFLAGSFWQLAEGNDTLSSRYQLAGGVMIFVGDLFDFYLLLVQLLNCVDFPYQLPVGDLSRVFLGRAKKQQLKREKSEESHLE